MRKLPFILAGSALVLAGSALAMPGSGKHHGPATRAQAEAGIDAMFTQLDANQDGVLDARDRAARTAEHFDTLDANRDGVLSKEEFASGAPGFGGKFGPGHGMGKGKMGMHGPDGHGAPGQFAQKVDTDGDGAISKAEFRAAGLARFDKADANGDGTISKEEHKAHKQARKQEHKALKAAQPGN